MPETIQEFVSSSGGELRVDEGASILRGVKLLGLTSQNGRTYSEQALRDAAPLYEGAKVNVNHPKGGPLAPRDYQDRIGVIHDVQLKPGVGLFGRLRFNPKHPLAEQLVWDAQHAPANVGLSHNVLARMSRNGTSNMVEEITKVQSVDLVADPAATRGLFEETNPDDCPPPQPPHDGAPIDIRWDVLTRESLELHRPDLVEEMLAPLSEQLDERIAREATSERRSLVAELLAEHGLPMPKHGEAHPIVSTQFMQSLVEAADEGAVRSLIQERATLVRSAREHRDAADVARPISRDQLSCSTTNLLESPKDARRFAELIHS